MYFIFNIICEWLRCLFSMRSKKTRFGRYIRRKNKTAWFTVPYFSLISDRFKNILRNSDMKTAFYSLNKLFGTQWFALDTNRDDPTILFLRLVSGKCRVPRTIMRREISQWSLSRFSRYSLLLQTSNEQHCLGITTIGERTQRTCNSLNSTSQ